MTKEQYVTLLAEIADVIERKNTEIYLLKYQLEEANKKLEEAEKHLPQNLKEKGV